MRQFKFRIWDKEKRGWFLTKIPFSLFGECVLLGGLFSEINSSKLDNYVIQQFTGLKDKNGVEIYEGDIVKYPQDSGIPDAYDVMSVEWDLDCDGFGGLHCGFRIGGDYARWNNTEVIGNILENSDLLK